jgi:hypothetical protein
LQASKPDSDEAARKALASFSEAYWPPLYTFVRRRGYSSADAQDLIQGFFVHLFEHNTLSRADREKGRLRTFLLGSLQNFLLKERERMRAIKRGGNHQFVSFELLLPQAEAAMYATAHLSDLNAYDVAWASTIVTRAWKNMRERFAAEGKREWVDELRLHFMSQPLAKTAGPTPSGIAGQKVSFACLMPQSSVLLAWLVADDIYRPATRSSS